MKKIYFFASLKLLKILVLIRIRIRICRIRTVPKKCHEYGTMVLKVQVRNHITPTTRN
jgi:hypothetical protein